MISGNHKILPPPYSFKIALIKVFFVDVLVYLIPLSSQIDFN
nr:MAG TPA: hypothetical protein [Caudoviricetes sp.]